MREDIFKDCFEMRKSNQKKFWDDLAEKYGFISGEAIRSSYRREKKKRDILEDQAEYVSNSESGTSLRKDFPFVLILDIETAPLLVFSWGVYDQRILPENVVSDWFTLSFAAKWLFEKDIISNVLLPNEVAEKNDERIIKQIWNLLDKADIVVTYNGNNFDLKRLNSRFALYQLPPPSYYFSVDLYQTNKQVFGWSSNKLDMVNKTLGIEAKTDVGGMEKWRKCYFGDPQALKDLEFYNRNDSVITEMLYLRLLPWVKNHPNINVYTQDDVQVCPKCGSEHLTWDKDKFYYTQTSKYGFFRCDDCKSTGRGKKNLLTKEKSKGLVR